MNAVHRLEHTVVTLDGPAGSGKSTVARRLAERLGFLFLDTGAMYRAATLAALRAGVVMEPLDEDAALAAVENARLDLDPDGHVRLDGQLVESQLRTAEVTRCVSRVSAIPEIRTALSRMQRRFGEQARPGVVAEGRDMATVVFPDATHRFYLDADIEERARRRRGDLASRGGEPPELSTLVEDIRERDRYDSSREIAPLCIADGVTVVDTTHRSLDEVVSYLQAAVAPGVIR